MTMSVYEDAIKKFLRKISPDRDWQYISEVEHVWMTELYDELVAECKDENANLREQLEYERQTSRSRLERIDQLRDENANQREYVEWLEDWVLSGFFTRDIEFQIKMKRHELGIEV